MFKKLFLMAVAGLGVAACKQPGRVETTKSGLRYAFFKGDTTGTRGKTGDIISVSMTMLNYKDSTLQTTAKMPGGMIEVPIPPVMQKGGIEEGLSLLSEGDSAVFYLSVDSLAKRSGGQPLPPYLKAGTDLKYAMRVFKIQSPEQATKARKETDAKALAAYAAKNKLTNVQKTASGVQYVMTQEGTGVQPKPGDSVFVHYTLKMSDGKLLESSRNNPAAKPFGFPLGQRMVIAGWDEGIALFKKGGKGTLLLPSELAYGSQGNQNIPPNTVLIFDIELVDVKPAGPSVAMPPVPVPPVAPAPQR